jgi:HrpA-like RNA helicase
VVLYEETKGDVLAFLTGQEDIEETQTILKEKFNLLRMKEQVLILPLFANLPQD